MTCEYLNQANKIKETPGECSGPCKGCELANSCSLIPKVENSNKDNKGVGHGNSENHYQYKSTQSTNMLELIERAGKV